MKHTGNNDGGMNVLCWWGKLIREDNYLCVHTQRCCRPFVCKGVARNQCICCYGNFYCNLDHQYGSGA